MKLGIIVSDFPKVTETFVLRELIALHRRGYEIRVFHIKPYRIHEVVHEFAHPILGWARYRPFLFNFAVLGALFRAFWRRPGLFATTLWTVIRECWRTPLHLLKSLAIIPKSLAFTEDLKTWGAGHVHAEFAGYPGTCAWVIGRFSGIPYSVSCHAHDIFITQALLGPKLSEAAFVRSISRFNKRFLLDKVQGLLEERIHVVHCGLDLSSIPRMPLTGQTPFRILYVGSLHKRKGLDILLRAVTLLDREGVDWRLDLIGDGPEWGGLEALAQEFDIAEQVHFMGAQPNEVLEAALAGAHLLATPSTIGPGGRTEGIPVVLMEALAHQRPVIASRLSGIPELVRDGETGTLVEPGNVEDLLQALLWVHAHPHDAHDQAVRGRELLEREFDVEKVAVTLDELMRSAAK